MEDLLSNAEGDHLPHKHVGRASGKDLLTLRSFRIGTPPAPKACFGHVLHRYPKLGVDGIGTPLYRALVQAASALRFLHHPLDMHLLWRIDSTEVLRLAEPILIRTAQTCQRRPYHQTDKTCTSRDHQEGRCLGLTTGFALSRRLP